MTKICSLKKQIPNFLILISTSLLLLSCFTMLRADYVFPIFASDSSNIFLMPTENKNYLNECELRAKFGQMTLYQDLLKEKGDFLACSINFNAALKQNLFAGVKGDYIKSTLRGNLKENVTKLKSKAKYSSYSTEFNAGVKFGVFESHLSPFVLLGYEKQTHHQKKPVLYAKKSEINYYFTGMGAKAVIKLTPQLSTGFLAKIMWPFNSVERVQGERDIKSKGFGRFKFMHFEIETPFCFQLAENIKLVAAPFLSLKKYDHKKVVWLNAEKLKVKSYGLNVALNLVY